MLMNVVVVDEQRANVQKVDVEEKRSLGARNQDINKRIMLMPIATTPKTMVSTVHLSPSAPDLDRPSYAFPLV